MATEVFEKMKIAEEAQATVLPVDIVWIVDNSSSMQPAIAQIKQGLNAFAGLIDLIKMKALIWKGEQLGAEWDEVEIPADMKEEAEKYHATMVEKIVEFGKHLVEDAEKTVDLAEKTGLSTDAVQKFGFVAESAALDALAVSVAVLPKTHSALCVM